MVKHTWLKSGSHDEKKKKEYNFSSCEKRWNVDVVTKYVYSHKKLEMIKERNLPCMLPSFLLVLLHLVSLYLLFLSSGVQRGESLFKDPDINNSQEINETTTDAHKIKLKKNILIICKYFDAKNKLQTADKSKNNNKKKKLNRK